MRGKKRILVAAVLIWGGISGTAGATTYSIVEITNTEGEELYPIEMNNSGQVLTHLGIWKNGEVTPINVPDLREVKINPWTGLPTPRLDEIVTGINDLGQVVGTVQGDGLNLYGSLPFVWQGGGTEVPYRNYSMDPVAKDINNLGQVVCSVYGGSIVVGKGESTYIVDYEAIMMNDSGQVVVRNPYGARRNPYLWEDGAFTELGALEIGGRTEVTDINNSGQVVGWSTIEGNNSGHAFLWEQGTMIDLGTFGGARSEAMSINDRGQVVGGAQTADGDWHAFLWENGLLVDLNDMLGPGNDWEVVFADGINNPGQIIGAGIDPSGRRGRDILMNPTAPPVPEPATMLLTGVGLAGAGISSMRRKKRTT